MRIKTSIIGVSTISAPQSDKAGVKAQRRKTVPASVLLSINSISGSVVNNAVFLIRASVDSSSEKGAIVTPAPVSLSAVFTVSLSYSEKSFCDISGFFFREMTAHRHCNVKFISHTPSARLTLCIKTILHGFKYGLHVQRQIL